MQLPKKTGGGKVPEIVMKTAAADVANCKSLSEATEQHGVDLITLIRYSARKKTAS